MATFPDPLPGESYESYINRVYNPPRNARPGERLDEFTARKAQYNIDFNNKLADKFPGTHEQATEQALVEARAYAEGAQAGRAAAASTVPTTAAPPTTTPRPASTGPTSTRPSTTTATTTPRNTTPPTTAPTVPTTTAPPTGAESVLGSQPPSAPNQPAEEETEWPYAPPSRWGIGVPSSFAQAATGGKPVIPPFSRYTGAGLVGMDGYVSLDDNNKIYYYDPSNDAGAVYAGMSPTDRTAILTTLYQKGFYSSGSVGEYQSDVLAISRWLEASNNAGVTRDRFLFELGSSPNVNQPRSGGGRRISVTNPNDLKAVARKVSLDGIGRELSDEELNGFVTYFQNLERKAQTGQSTEQAPAVTTGAEMFIEQTAPTEQDAYTYMNYVNKIFSAIG